MTFQPEPWLRGPLPGIPAALQPAGHALVMALEDSSAAAAELTADQVWLRPGGAAAVGFHLRHLAGSTGRLLTYARGEALSAAQRAALAAEQAEQAGQLARPSLSALLEDWRVAVQRALSQLEHTDPAILHDVRTVGRAQLPSTVQGLLFHAAEHAQRHAGQLVTTVKIVTGLNLREGR